MDLSSGGEEDVDAEPLLHPRCAVQDIPALTQTVILFVLEELFWMALAKKTTALTKYFTEVDPAEVMQMEPVNLQKNVSTVKQTDSMLLPGIVKFVQQ